MEIDLAYDIRSFFSSHDQNVYVSDLIVDGPFAVLPGLSQKRLGVLDGISEFQFTHEAHVSLSHIIGVDIDVLNNTVDVVVDGYSVIVVNGL